MRAATLLGCAALIGALSAGRAEAQGEYEEPWFFTIDAGVTGPLNDPPTTMFNVGGNASFGVYRSLFPEFAVGSRVTTGVLSEGEDVQGIADQGVLDYGFLGASVRYRPFARLMPRDGMMSSMRRASGLFIDFTPGLALLDGDAVPAYETGLGYNIPIGPVTLGPQFRFTHFIETHGRFGDHHVTTWTGALEVAFLDQARAPREVRAERPMPERVAVDRDRDGDWILDERDSCPDEAETWNGFEDVDGCPDDGVGQFENDALVVDERVFFDFDSAELRPTGAAQLDAVAQHYEANARRLEHLVIGGHADVRGADQYNESLSEQRAEAVVVYLKDRGVPGTAIRVRAFGEDAPEIANADTEFEHQVNRRVEFGLEWREGMRPEGREPVAHRTMPDYVDEAPPEVQERERRLAAREHQRERIAARQRAREETAS